MTEEEAAALEAEGDPIEAPPGEYKILVLENSPLHSCCAKIMNMSTMRMTALEVAGIPTYQAKCQILLWRRLIKSL